MALRTIAVEVRDRMTFIPMIATNVCSGNERENFLVRRLGFSPSYEGSVMVIQLEPLKAYCDVYHVENIRTREAVRYIQENFDQLKEGDVIDIEFILEEVDTPKISEFFELNRK